jgi:hypothetical protein
MISEICLAKVKPGLIPSPSGGYYNTQLEISKLLVERWQMNLNRAWRGRNQTLAIALIYWSPVPDGVKFRVVGMSSWRRPLLSKVCWVATSSG